GRRMRLAEEGILELQKSVDTLIVIPNQNLFRIANDKTTFADAFAMADQVLYSGVACITDLMVKEGLINLDFADVRSVMREMGRAMMGTGEASGEGRAMAAAEAAIANPLLDETSMKGAQGLLISITGGRDLTLFEVDEAATRIREEVDPDANIILGATFDEELEGLIRVSVVATGIDRAASEVAARNADFRSQSKPIIRPSAAVPVQAVAPAPQPVMQQPIVQQPVFDPIAEAIRASEENLERELAIPASHPLQAQPVAQVQEEVRLQNRLFAAPAETPVVQRQAPVQQQPQPAPVMQQRVEPAAPIIRQEPQTMRMPKIEDFPPVVKAEIDHRSAPQPVAHQEERGPMGLLKRLTSSLGRHEEAPAAQEAAPAAQQQRRPLSPEASLYAPRRGQLDDHGRANPQPRSLGEDDQLEIPAFLRRQSN
ncbi:MAG: cell division protein FtsZ, partial [Shinella sp.]